MEYPSGWKSFFKKNWELVSDILLAIHESEQVIQPERKDVFRMFYLIRPEDIKVIVVGQSPYPNDHACGIPFLSRKLETTQSLKNIHKELVQEFPAVEIKEGDMNDIILSWISQGVFLTNVALTIGIQGRYDYLFDHSIIWQEFIWKVLEYVGGVPILLMGSLAWKFDTLPSCIKVPHPVSRGGEFIGCDVFRKCNDMLGDNLILWVSTKKNKKCRKYKKKL